MLFLQNYRLLVLAKADNALVVWQNPAGFKQSKKDQLGVRINL